MKNIFHFNIIIVIVALVASLSTNTYAENSGNPKILEKLDAHDIEIKADIVKHDDIMTTEHSELDTKLDEILAALQNGGGPEAPVAKTGQTKSFVTGDDGDLEKGVKWPNPRFTDNQDGTITDNLTHLIWDKNADRFGARHWSQAINDCNELADNGVDLIDGSVAGNWHLANVKEYMSLFHYGVFNPAVPNTSGTGQWNQGNPFNNVRSYFYFSSTLDARWPASTEPWVPHLGDAHVVSGNKINNFYVWCVRGGE